MDNMLFIINPVAGKGKAKEIIPLIQQRMKELDIKYEIIITVRPKEAITIAMENVDMYPRVIAVGGDGTINEVAKGLVKSRKGILGIIPSGTGNDLSKSLGLSMDPNKALETIINGNVKNIDIGTVNDISFLNIASVGFDAEVVRHTDIIKKKIKSKIAYIFAVITTLFVYRSKNVELIIDNISYSRNSILLAVGNGIFYGGGMKILPMALIDDGFFHICLVKDISNLKILFLFPSIFKGNHIKYSKYVEIFKAKEVILKNDRNNTINIDGELVSSDKDIVFKISDYRLGIISQ